MKVLVSLVVLFSCFAALVAAVAVPEPTLMVRQGKGKGKGDGGGSTSSSVSETSASFVFSDPTTVNLARRRVCHRNLYVMIRVFDVIL